MSNVSAENGRIIDVDSIPVVNLLELFKGEMLKLDDLVDRLYNDTSNIKITWQGYSSDSILSKVDDLKKVFDEIRRKNIDYVNFIDSTINKYKAMDTSQRNYVDTEKGALDTSLYG